MSAVSVLSLLISVFSKEILVENKCDKIDHIEQQPISRKEAKKLKKKIAREQRKKRMEQRKKKRDIQFQEKLNSAIKIKENLSLPTAINIKIKDAINHRDERVEIRGWIKHIYRMRSKGRPLMFVQIIDDKNHMIHESLQCVFEADLCKTKTAILMTVGTPLTLRGQIVPYKQQCELRVDYYESLDVSYFKINELPYLIYGCVRLHNCMIPMDIKMMLMLFVGDIWNDTWDLITKNKHIELDGNTVITTAWYGTASRNTVFGTKIVYGSPFCEKYKWRLQMIHSNEYGNRHCILGVIPQQNVSDKMLNWFVSKSYGGYGYCHRNGSKFHDKVCDFSNNVYGPPLKAGDIIEFELDMEHRTLRYYVNGTDLGIAYDNVKDCDYRLAVTMGWKEEKVKLLKSYSNLHRKQ